MCTDRSFWKQVAFENEGAIAALAGKTHADSPYSQTGDAEDVFRWNHWIFGFDMAAEEKHALESGTGRYSKIGKDLEVIETWEETTEEAYRRGHWTPRYVKVPEEWKKKGEPEPALSKP